MAAVPAMAVAAPKQIRTASEFSQHVVGKTVDGPGYQVVIKADGTAAGKTDDGHRLTLNWVWDKGRWCRRLIVGKTDQGTDCFRWAVDGSTFTLTGKNGTQTGELR
ncbi:hypothetical protein OB2597_02087 [Pseudooceanicola batsensis HTCC2597]|uniref:Dihydrodipicolinate reductase n=1 Tax=Pseudooceanicola batsensis (strain ATCC BAA-863 / DSM 15984 / KCTC 12145 / HTCC2597) TaxID=252305 RepID=A3TX11_PSEBH|nr:hypothetical protein [Pseudooceanicola batsensis]EAQ03371.1 hypothetical protein OB2597_02087 [Pseudooceanicola batsensis HTCC2597]